AGNTVLELLLADGFENPFTGSPSAPVNGAADSPGEIGYIPVTEGDWNVGYVVTGFGAEALVATLSNLGSPEEAKVIANCYILRQGAEDGYDSWVGYPLEIDAHPYYHIWLPRSLVDPYTGLDQLPVSRTAASRGEIGYVAIVKDDLAIGYVITGYGNDSVICALSSFGYSREEALLASECRRIQRSVEEYAIANDGLFPGMAACRPGAAYETIRMNEWNVGYRIKCSVRGTEFLEIATSPEEARVRLNCLLLKQALEESAAQNEGVYPENVDKDRLPGGSVVDLLPRAHLLENPYTGTLESPVNHSAGRPGEIGYAAIPEYHSHCPWCGGYIPPGYVITGFLRGNRQIVVTNLKIGAIDAIVMSHCRTVQLAVEEFAARNNGVYPSDVDSDGTPFGETVTDLLPDGCLLPNPVTWCATEPISGHAAIEGEIGYVPYVQNGINRGYEITGIGTEAGTTIMAIVRELPGLGTR
ncbi:MAG: hypothetical protein NTW97_01890, partial [Candidatus Krumholzibacteria bacterium]|nr:hypothetical protein [Candidatus Krumholzibacteria bacterium]